MPGHALPQSIVPPHPLETRPHWPVLHVVLGTQHAGHVRVPPHPSGCEPQTPAHVFLVQHWPATPPPPPQTCTALQMPHDTIWPQLFTAELQLLPAQASLFGTHLHCDGEPTHVSFAAHAVHCAMSEHPLLRSMGTHLLPHFLVPAAQLPMTQAFPAQMRVPDPGAGQVVASHVVAPHPNVGSSIATHLPAHFFVPAPHVPITHAPPWHANVAVPAAGQVDLSQVVAPQP